MEEQTPEIQIQEPVLPVAEMPMTAKKKFNLNIILPILGVILLIGGGVYAFRFFGGPKACTSEAMVCPDGSAVGRVGSNCEFAPCPQSTEIPTAMPSADETADWKTYVDNKFSFQYPSLWLITDKLLHIGGDNLDVAIESRTGDELVVLSQAEGFGSSPDEGLEPILTRVEGISGEKRVSSGLITVRVKKEGMEYLISYKFDERQKEVKEIVFDQILSTFKFTD